MESCPACNADVWDNVEENNKREAKGDKLRPDYSCKDKEGCGWVMWREKGVKKVIAKSMLSTPPRSLSAPNGDERAKTMVLAYAKDLVVALINGGVAPPDPTGEVIAIYRKLMAEIEK